MTVRDVKAQIRPSQINLRGFLPLTATFKRTEREVAVAMLVAICQERDEWGPCRTEDGNRVLAKLREDSEYAWLRLPRGLCQPAFGELVEHGIATLSEDGTEITLTESAIETLAASMWCRPTAAPGSEVSRG